MINFLPPDAASAVKREYIVCVAGVWALLLAAVALVEVLLLLPTYVLLSRQLDALAAEVAPLENAESVRVYEAARSALLQTQHIAAQLAAAPVGVLASEVLHAVQKAQTDAIALSGFSYEHTGAVTKALQIKGIARTREALVEFSAALERDPLFARAEVPVADLAKVRDLPFTLILTLAGTAH